MANSAYQIIVIGVVQGVGFRHYTRKKAESLGLEGEVQNLDDGTVNIEVSGEEERLEAFLEWCHKGPPSARVDRLDYTKIPVTEYSGFKIIR